MVKTICANCEKELERKPCRIKERNYCNTKCQNIYEYSYGIKDKNQIIINAQKARRKQGKDKFKNNPTKRIGKRGYWLIYIPGKGHKYEHQYIWEKNYGLTPEGYVIHHINLNKTDNRIENLQMILKKEHHKLHDKLRKRNNKGQFKCK